MPTHIRKSMLADSRCSQRGYARQPRYASRRTKLSGGERLADSPLTAAQRRGTTHLYAGAEAQLSCTQYYSFITRRQYYVRNQ
jgi:hypothetical protein